MTKAEIVQAAFKVWGRELYQHTSLSALAKELGVSKPALYRHFAGKQALTAAMAEHFFDEFTAYILPGYEQAIQGKNPQEDIFILMRSITGFYARNVDAFVFSLINVYDKNKAQFDITEHLKRRGLDMDIFRRTAEQAYSIEPILMVLMFTTLTFFMAHFHKAEKSFTNPPSEAAMQHITIRIHEVIVGGLRFKHEQVDGLNYEELENRVSCAVHQVEDDPLLRAVAQTVAEAGPWEASMNMVAHRSGLSKSSLYGHFKSKQDMLHQLFRTEFERILGFARQGIGMSSNAGEQLYLGIFSIAVYLRSRPDILVALDWLRTRRLDLDRRHEKNPGFFRLFEDIDLGALQGGGGNADSEEEKQQISHWILFLLVNILMKKDSGQEPESLRKSVGNVRNSDIRTLYRFVAMGMEGFKK
jgi:AcrR family transcriptional regulator